MKQNVLMAAFGVAIAVGSFLMVNDINEPPLSVMDIGIGFMRVALIGLGGLVFIIAIVAIIKSVRYKQNIPHGSYCYDKNGVCPYWSINCGHEKQNNGYCAYLKIGDWDIYEHRIGTWHSLQLNGSYKKAEATGKEMGLYTGLLWDKVKECDINS